MNCHYAIKVHVYQISFDIDCKTDLAFPSYFFDLLMICFVRNNIVLVCIFISSEFMIGSVCLLFPFFSKFFFDKIKRLFSKAHLFINYLFVPNKTFSYLFVCQSIDLYLVNLFYSLFLVSRFVYYRNISLPPQKIK